MPKTHVEGSRNQTMRELSVSSQIRYGNFGLRRRLDDLWADFGEKILGWLVAWLTPGLQNSKRFNVWVEEEVSVIATSNQISLSHHRSAVSSMSNGFADFLLIASTRECLQMRGKPRQGTDCFESALCLWCWRKWSHPSCFAVHLSGRWKDEKSLIKTFAMPLDWFGWTYNSKSSS